MTTDELLRAIIVSFVNVLLFGGVFKVEPSKGGTESGSNGVASGADGVPRLTDQRRAAGKDTLHQTLPQRGLKAISPPSSGNVGGQDS